MSDWKLKSHRGSKAPYDWEHQLIYITSWGADWEAILEQGIN